MSQNHISKKLNEYIKTYQFKSLYKSNSRDYISENEQTRWNMIYRNKQATRNWLSFLAMADYYEHWRNRTKAQALQYD